MIVYKENNMDKRVKTTKWKDGAETWYFLAIAKLIYSNKNIIIYS